MSKRFYTEAYDERQRERGFITETEARLLKKGEMVYVLLNGWHEAYFIRTGVHLGGFGIYVDIPGEGNMIFRWLDRVKLPDISEIGMFKE